MNKKTASKKDSNDISGLIFRTVCNKDYMKKGEPLYWEEIVEKVNSRYTIKSGGWMLVRNSLQAVLDSGRIERTNSVEDEAYIFVK